MVPAFYSALSPLLSTINQLILHRKSSGSQREAGRGHIITAPLFLCQTCLLQPALHCLRVSASWRGAIDATMTQLVI